MRVVGVAAMTALIGMAALAAPARAQMMGGDGPHINLLGDSASKTPDEIEADQEKQKAYKDSLRKIPDAKAPNDPWGAVRSDAPKAAPAKTAKAKPKAETKAKAEAKTGPNQN